MNLRFSKSFLFLLIILLSVQAIDIPGHFFNDVNYSISIFSEEGTGDEDSDERKELDKNLNRLNSKFLNSQSFVNHFTKYHRQIGLCCEEVNSPPPRS